MLFLNIGWYLLSLVKWLTSGYSCGIRMGNLGTRRKVSKHTARGYRKGPGEYQLRRLCSVWDHRQHDVCLCTQQECLPRRLWRPSCHQGEEKRSIAYIITNNLTILLWLISGWWQVHSHWSGFLGLQVRGRQVPYGICEDHQCPPMDKQDNLGRKHLPPLISYVGRFKLNVFAQF